MAMLNNQMVPKFQENSINGALKHIVRRRGSEVDVTIGLVLVDGPWAAVRRWTRRRWTDFLVMK